MKEQYVLVGKPPDEYLTNLTLQSKNATAISEAILEFTGNYINDELKVIGCNSTNVNTGCMGGVIYRIKEKIEYRVISM